jgi:hypothetical protein
MKWSEMDISFRPKDHPETELSNWNLPFMVKLPIGRHKVAKMLVDNVASLNIIMRKTFIKMGIILSNLTPVHDTFHSAIRRQSHTPIGCIDLDVSCGSGDNKCWEMLTFEVASFDIGYNCILGRPFLLMFMAVINTAYATMKMSGSKGIITIKADQLDALACENAYAPWTSMGTTTQKGVNTTSASTHPPADQKADNKKKGRTEDEDNKEILADPVILMRCSRSAQS